MTLDIHALTHIGLLTDDIERTAQLWQRLFSAERVDSRPTWHAVEEGVLTTFLTLPGGVIEPLQPTAQNVYREAHHQGRRAYHISVQVQDIRSAVERFRRAGLWVQLRPPGEVLSIHRGWIDADSTGGLPIELIDTGEMAGFVGEEELAALSGDVAGAASWVQRWAAIGHLVHDLDLVGRVFDDVLGFTPDTDEPVEVGSEVRVQRFRLSNGPAVDLVQPLDPHSALGNRLDKAGPGISYLSFEVADVDAAVGQLSDQEAWLSHPPARDGLPDRAWVHGRSTDGLPVQLVNSEGPR